MNRSVWLLPASILLVGAADGSSDERVIEIDNVIDAVINGVPARMHIDPAGLGMPMLTKDFAVRAELKPGPIGIGYSVGPELISARTAVVRVHFGEGSIKRRLGWTQAPFNRDFDGVMGPGSLDEPVIRFVLRPSLPGEKTTTLPLNGGSLGGWGESFARIDVGGVPVLVRFDPKRAVTVATAPAGALVAKAHDGQLTGETTAIPIAFGIERPVRMMALNAPLQIGSRSLTAIGVRTSDYGSASSIPEQGAREDPDEAIVVTAQKKRNPRRDRIDVGRDILDHCSSLVFDKRAKQIRLTCA